MLNGLVLNVIKQYDESIKDSITKEDVAEIRKIIKDFHAVDPDSFSFRYHETKDGQNTLRFFKYYGIKTSSLCVEYFRHETSGNFFILIHYRF